MKENEFDIYVRNLMAGAEETVPPEVWKGVEAGLDRAARSRKTVPVWLWRGLAATGVAAAAAAAFVWLHPSQNLSNQPTIQTPVALAATDAPLPEESLPAEEDVIPTIDEQVVHARRLTARVPVEEPVLPAETETAEAEEPVAEPEVRPHRPDAVASPAQTQPEAVSSDEDAFRQLAFEEHRTHRRGTFSMSVLGNLQSNTRPESPASTVRRSAGMFLVPTPTQTGIQDERPEFSFSLPVSAGISFRYDFNPRWGIGTGITYTYLGRSFMGSYFEVADNGDVTKRLYDTDISNQQHYIGVPLNLYFNIVNAGNWNCHVRMDGTAEKLVDNRYIIHDSAGDIHLDQAVKGFQYSAGVGVGIEFKFTPNVGIYFDPTFRYYFDCKQPRSLRTIQPLRMDFEAGVRFSL